MPPASDITRIRAATARAWAAYRELWRKGRMGIALALLIPCGACWMCTAVASGLGLIEPVPTATPAPSSTPKPSALPRPTRTPRPTPFEVPATDTAEPPAVTEVPTVVPQASAPTTDVQQPVGQDPTPASPSQIQPLVGQPQAPPPAAEGPRRGAPQGRACPAGLPVKGNQGREEWIYHVPGGRSYDSTQPEECFATEADAQAAGYRAARN